MDSPKCKGMKCDALVTLAFLIKKYYTWVILVHMYMLYCIYYLFLSIQIQERWCFHWFPVTNSSHCGSSSKSASQWCITWFLAGWCEYYIQGIYVWSNLYIRHDYMHGMFHFTTNQCVRSATLWSNGCRPTFSWMSSETLYALVLS